MIEPPLKKFASFLIRTVETCQNDSVFRVMDLYLKGLETLSSANMDWIAAHFSA